MKIPTNMTDENSLAMLGVQAVQLLCAGDIPALVARFGYALALGREIESALSQDLLRCLTELHAKKLVGTGQQFSPEVNFFKENSTSLFAVVTCLVPTDNGACILLELVVTSVDSEKHITLEQLSVAA
ncbi:MAG TPA: hypothetical protein VJ463_08675 [Geothrix sp.]|nr:hypothetical protein [Geothrix sp.]